MVMILIDIDDDDDENKNREHMQSMDRTSEKIAYGGMFPTPSFACF